MIDRRRTVGARLDKFRRRECACLGRLDYCDRRWRQRRWTVREDQRVGIDRTRVLMIVIVVSVDLNSSGRPVPGMRVDNEEMRMDLAEVAIVVMLRMNVLERRKQESQQHGEAGLYGGRTAHSLKVYRSGHPGRLGSAP